MALFCDYAVSTGPLLFLPAPYGFAALNPKSSSPFAVSIGTTPNPNGSVPFAQMGLGKDLSFQAAITVF